MRKNKRRGSALALPLGVTALLMVLLTLVGCGEQNCCPFSRGNAYIVAEREMEFKFVDPFEIGKSHRSYEYMEYWGTVTPLTSPSITHTGLSDIDNTHAIPIFVFLDYLAPEEGRWAQQSAYRKLFDVGTQLTPPFVSSVGYNYFQFPAALALYHQKYCPEVSGTGISDNTADSGYYTFLDQCQGVIVIKPGETKPFHYDGYGRPRE